MTDNREIIEMLKEFLKAHIKSQAAYVEVGYAQVEPNHLSA